MYSILVVSSYADLYREVLAHRATLGYPVIWARNGKEAHRVVASEKICLAIVQRKLEDIGGVELSRQLRAQQALLLLVIVADKPDKIDEVVCLETGADQYLGRPFSSQVLTRQLRTLLRWHPSQQRAGRVPVFEHPPFEINDELRQVRVEGSSLPLTISEFALLRAFLSYSGELLNREHLLRALPSTEITSSDALNIHVSRLRAKIKDVVPSACIYTVRGVGYKFELPPPAFSLNQMSLKAGLSN